MTAVVLLWTFALPHVPGPDEPRPVLFTVYVAAFVFHWTVLALVVTVRLLRGGRGEPTAARRRMQLLGGASALLTAGLVLAAFDPAERFGVELATSLLVTGSAVGFLLGLQPPAILRLVWRRPEQAEIQSAIAELMTATTEDEVAQRVLPPMARTLGARAAVLRVHDHVASSYGSPDLIRELEGATESTQRIHLIDIPDGAIALWTSPYAPFFGREELRLLETLAALVGLALDRSRLFSHEVEARRILERADELKTQFIALAAHELRTPVAAIHGLVQTLALRGEQLADEDRARIDAALRDQSARMRLLVDELLDLSRLDAEAVEIEPERFLARPRVEELATVVAGERADDVAVDIDPGLVVSVDPNAFDRVLSNLIGNALRYGEPPVVVHAERRDRHLHLSVEDNGPGVGPDFVPYLFDRFSRFGSTRDRVVGTGLGLAIARSYARAHGGDLVYEPAHPHGARFRLVLPAESG
jgi:signal transduction histidine kinase